MKNIIVIFLILVSISGYSQKRITVKQAKIDSTLIWQGDTINFNFFEDTARIDTLKFTDLYDTPSSYSGQAGKIPIVNAGETALEFGGITNIWQAAFGKLYLGTTQTMELSTYPDIDTTISAWTIGDTLYCKANTSGYLLPRSSGMFVIRYSVSFDPVAADTVRTGIWVNDTEKVSSMSRGLMPVNGSSLSGTDIIELTTTDTLRLKMRSFAGTRYNVLYGNVNIHKIK